MIVLMGRTKGVSGYMADRRPVTGGTNGEKWGKMGNLFYGESGKQIGKFPIFPHFFKNFIYFYRFFLRSIGCIFIDQYFRVEVKKQDIRLISSV